MSSSSSKPLDPDLELLLTQNNAVSLLPKFQDLEEPLTLKELKCLKFNHLNECKLFDEFCEELKLSPSQKIKLLTILLSLQPIPPNPNMCNNNLINPIKFENTNETNNNTLINDYNMGYNYIVTPYNNTKQENINVSQSNNNTISLPTLDAPQNNINNNSNNTIITTSDANTNNTNASIYSSDSSNNNNSNSTVFAIAKTYICQICNATNNMNNFECINCKNNPTIIANNYKNNSSSKKRKKSKKKPKNSQTIEKKDSFDSPINTNNNNCNDSSSTDSYSYSSSDSSSSSDSDSDYSMNEDTKNNSKNIKTPKKNVKQKVQNNPKISSKINGKKVHKCKFCSKILSSANSLKTHSYQHTNDWPYRCNWCNKGFASKYNTKLHEMTHTGERPYECDKCNKKFKVKSDLVKHQNNCKKKEIKENE